MVYWWGAGFAETFALVLYMGCGKKLGTKVAKAIRAHQCR